MKTARYIKARNSNNADEVMQAVKLWLSDAMNGEYTLVLERAKSPRSNNQNRLMWLWFTCIAKSWSEATGQTFTAQTVHDVYCRLFLPMETPRGRIAGHTNKLSVEQMTEFLDKVQADAASEYGIQLPNPEDMYFEVWAKQYGY
jgi:hypothetical protein